jgi:YHS domain-containing protein
MKPVLILVAIFLAVRFFKKSYLKRSDDRPASEPGHGRAQGQVPQKEGEEMVLDPVCNSYIPLSTAVHAQVLGKTEYFCTEACRDKFLGSR